jgi:serine/threonine protein kinase
LKPENVILRENDAVLIDFDAARLHKPQAEADTQILGTTGFAAPEQYGLGQSDTRTDIYSLGVLMNVMLTGQHPSQMLAEGRMGRVIGRCTQVNPEKRYKDVVHLMDAL